jgi:putative PIN family toxin of toxin-antitoxin system
MRSPVVVDTNVVAAGLLSGDAASPVVPVLDGMLAAAFPYVLSEALLAEYHAVLMRPKLRRLHGLSDGEVEAVLTELAQHAIVLDPPHGQAPAAPDPGDQMLWDLLSSRTGLRLVTGDARLLQDLGMQGRVVTPRAFIDSL